MSSNLTELPIKSYFEQLFQQKGRRGNYIELFNRMISMHNENPDNIGKFMLLKHENLDGDSVYYLYDLEEQSVNSGNNDEVLLASLTKPKNFVAVNYLRPVIANDNKQYVQIALSNPEIINHLEELWQTENTLAVDTQ